MVAGKRLLGVLLKISAVSAIMCCALFSPLSSQARQTDAAGQLPNGTSLKKVYVGLYENKPKVYTDETGRPSGIFIEILEEIARKEQWGLVYVPCSWSECFAALEEGRIDLMPDVAFSQERGRSLDFNEDQVIESWSQVYAHSNDSINTLSDLDGKRIALLNGSIQHNVLQEMMKGFGYEVTFIQTETYEDAFSLAAQGTADAAVSNHFFGDY
ncbi:MAG TPA: transporter substrate-binding domain-containing protein, partial [Deltaproteobacteria bacterium]|nr:transporter substrate-binding domain-containing protein [Deltaproteobacteria bacterium]